MEDRASDPRLIQAVSAPIKCPSTVSTPWEWKHKSLTFALPGTYLEKYPETAIIDSIPGKWKYRSPTPAPAWYPTTAFTKLHMKGKQTDPQSQRIGLFPEIGCS
jgi:hypothetical protein